MDAPEVRYAKSGDVNIAYSVVGDGPFDLVFVVGSVFTALEYAWEGPPGEFFSELASFSRLIVFDKRGTGLSDRVADFASSAVRMDDIRTVMDAAGSERAAVTGVSEGGPMAVLFAATYPQRAAALILYGTGASYRVADDYPWASTPEEHERWVQRREGRWGDADFQVELLHVFAPSIADDPQVQRWWTRYARTSASPRDAAHLARMNALLDVRHALPGLQAPTLVLHWRDEKVFQVEEAQYLADHIPGAIDTAGERLLRQLRRPGARDSLRERDQHVGRRARPFGMRWGCTPGNARWSTERSAGSPCTSGLGSQRRPSPAKSSSRAP